AGGQDAARAVSRGEALGFRTQNYFDQFDGDEVIDLKPGELPLEPGAGGAPDLDREQVARDTAFDAVELRETLQDRGGLREGGDRSARADREASGIRLEGETSPRLGGA